MDFWRRKNEGSDPGAAPEVVSRFCTQEGVCGMLDCVLWLHICWPTQALECCTATHTGLVAITSLPHYWCLTKCMCFKLELGGLGAVIGLRSADSEQQPPEEEEGFGFQEEDLKAAGQSQPPTCQS